MLRSVIRARCPFHATPFQVWIEYDGDTARLEVTLLEVRQDQGGQGVRDPRIGKCDEDDLELVLKLGLLCLHPDHRRRPSMRQVVVQILEGAAPAPETLPEDIGSTGRLFYSDLFDKFATMCPSTSAISAATTQPSSSQSTDEQRQSLVVVRGKFLLLFNSLRRKGDETKSEGRLWKRKKKMEVRINGNGPDPARPNTLFLLRRRTAVRRIGLFMEAMQENTIDVVKRMKEITLVMKTRDDVLQSQGVTPENIEDMLDELQEHVESTDMANAKAAEVVSTIVKNNPKSQQLVMESNGLEPLLTNFSSDPSTNSRTKSLGAISCKPFASVMVQTWSQIRHNQQGVAAFRLGNGYAALKEDLRSDDARLQRKALHLVQYLLHDKADMSVATELGLPKLMMHLASSDDSGVRAAVLGGLLELARDKTSVSENTLPDQDKLKDVLK
ncbi:hypothetical protein ABZP36_006033 [Zizania latifolia]